LIKLIFDEPGSDAAGELWDRADLLVSGQLLYPEARAALAAAERGRVIRPAAHRAAQVALESLHDPLHIVGIDEPLARTAGDLAAEHGLRGYDAVHLASALAIDAADVLMATWDRTLNNAAHRTGRLLVNQLD
jgi:predicted nucleic acid-binding protein